MINEKITGTGLIFPIEITNGTVKLSTGVDLVRSCIHNILAFEPGGKYFQRDFGVPLRSLISEPNDSYVEAILDYKLQTQLPMWDKRIIVDDVTVTRDGSRLSARVKISFTGTTPLITENVVVPLNSFRT